jgi:hypothetical protein
MGNQCFVESISRWALTPVLADNWEKTGANALRLMEHGAVESGIAVVPPYQHVLAVTCGTEPCKKPLSTIYDGDLRMDVEFRFTQGS